MEDLKINDTKFYIGTGAEIAPIYKTMLKHGYEYQFYEPARFNKERLYSLRTGDYDEDGVFNPNIVCVDRAKGYLADLILDIMPATEDREWLGETINSAVRESVEYWRIFRHIKKAREWLVKKRYGEEKRAYTCSNCDVCDHMELCWRADYL